MKNIASEVAIAGAVISAATDKRTWKIIGGIICSVIVLFMLPLIAYMGLSSQLDDIRIDDSVVTQEIVANLSNEEKDKLKHLETVMNEIEKEFADRQLNSSIKKAQALYACAFYYAEKSDDEFVTKLADCFENATDDADLLASLNLAFNTNISTDDFNNLMGVIKNTVIDIDDLDSSKNNLDLVKWAQYAYDNGWGYVWGSHGKVLTESELNRLKSVFGSHVTDKEAYIRSHWLGKRTSDCVGLIKGYGWYDEVTGTIKYGTHGMKDVTADGMYQAATEKGPMSTMPDIPGLCVWHQGHIGVYVGNGYVIHAANTYDGVIRTPITSSGWTHWLKCPYINYIDEGTENEESI